MRLSILATVNVLTLISTSLAQKLSPELSFGQTSPIADKDHNLHGFHVHGEGHVPRFMSDRIVLTPPYPGNKRGAIWAGHSNTAKDWSVDVSFRVNGQERAGGNFQFWYAANGASTVALSSVYTVEKFDGLAIVVDTHGGSSGTIRGFLNDGTKNHHADPMIDGHAFGHCDYTYRNLGRVSKLTTRFNTKTGLQVLIDDKPCFNSEKISLPTGDFFGITAASSETPDSFEVFSMATYTDVPASAPPPPTKNDQKDSNHQHQTQQKPIKTDPQQTTKRDPTTPDPEDTDPTTYQSSAAQFADLHNRLQLLSHAVHNLFREISAHTATEEKRYQEILRQLPSAATVKEMNSKIASIDKTLTSLKTELESSDHRGQFDRLHERFDSTHIGISEHLPDVLSSLVAKSAPRVGLLLGLVLVVQVGLAAAYILYKRRRSQIPKKYL